MTHQERLNSAVAAFVEARTMGCAMSIQERCETELRAAYAEYQADDLKHRLADAAIENDQLKNQLAAERASHETTKARARGEQGQRREG